MKPLGSLIDAILYKGTQLMIRMRETSKGSAEDGEAEES